MTEEVPGNEVGKSLGFRKESVKELSLTNCLKLLYPAEQLYWREFPSMWARVQVRILDKSQAKARKTLLCRPLDRLALSLLGRLESLATTVPC